MTDHHSIERPVSRHEGAEPSAWAELGADLLHDHHGELLRARLSGLIAGIGPSLAFEPIVHLHTGLRIGVEALARFTGPVPTGDWFRHAHRLGLGSDLELRVLDEVIRSLPDRDGFVTVNLSADAVLDVRTVEILRHTDATRLVVELTEQTRLPDLSVLRRRLDDLRATGAQLALHVDEFSADMLQRMSWASPAIVKFDPAITRALSTGRARAASAVNFMAACQQMGVFSVAVGVRDADQREVLRRFGIDATQGPVDTDPTA